MMTVGYMKVFEELLNMNNVTYPDKLGLFEMYASKLKYFKDVRTISFFAGGNSMRALDFIANVSTERDIIITRYQYPNMIATVSSPNVKLTEQVFETIFVDSAHLYSEEELNNIYLKLGKQMNQLFVLVG